MEARSPHNCIINSPVLEQGFSYIPGQNFEALLGTTDPLSFQKHWDDINVDTYAIERGILRKRSYTRLLYRGVDQSLVPSNDHLFFQDKSINQTFGGVNRTFSQATDEFLSSETLQKIILLDFESLPISAEDRLKNWIFGVHQINNYTLDQAQANVTPEGIHTDGHLYIVQHFIGSSNIGSGGLSRVYDATKTLVKEVYLCRYLDTILLHDEVMYHHVTPFTSQDTEQRSFRNMLLIDFDLS